MKAHLDDGRKSVELENFQTTLQSDFIKLVESALVAMGYEVEIKETDK